MRRVKSAILAVAAVLGLACAALLLYAHRQRVMANQFRMDKRVHNAVRIANGKDYRRALLLLEEIETTWPNAYELHEMRGAWLEGIGEKEAARRSYSRAYSLLLNDSHSLTNDRARSVVLEYLKQKSNGKE